MTNAEERILEALARRPADWLRPMDFGGARCSHHGNTTKRMAAKGWVQRERRNELNAPGPAGYFRGSYRYRITPAGLRALRNHAALSAAASGAEIA